MPFMSTALGGRDDGFDRRVHQAVGDDVDDVSRLLAEAFDLDGSVVAPIAGLARDGGTTARVWLLVEDRTPVSTVVSHVVDDAACIWCMATPGRFARAGYGRAVLGHALAQAAADGAAEALLGATPAGLPLYEATGWDTLERWDVYAYGPST